MSMFVNGKTNYAEWRDHSRDSAKYLSRVSLINAGIKSIMDEYKLVQSVNVSAMSGKLEGYYSVSTSVLMNPICQKRAQEPGSICAKCYAATTASRYAGLTQALETNYRILNEYLISESAWATLNWPTTNGDARVESFGDVASITCARNYLRIIKTHPHLNFGVWTKNVNIWIHAFELEGKPNNMTFVVSSPEINRPVDIPEEWMKFCDHRFTVYTKEYAEANNIKINCGGKKCATCRLCYRKDTEFNIRELLK